MKIKTLLIAAGALAAGVISSQAQVYSQNIVGYVNTPIAGSGSLTLIGNPLNGTTNTVESLMPSLQGGEFIYIWHNTAPVGFYIYQYQAGAQAGGNPSDWTDAGGVPIPNNLGDPNGTGYTFVNGPIVNPGIGFFVQEFASSITNTFVGTVQLSNTNAPTPIPGNGSLTMLSSVPPVAGNVETNPAIALPLQGGEFVYLWHNTAPVGYYIYQYQAGAQAGGNPSDWTDAGGVPIPGNLGDPNGTGYTFVNAPQLTVGAGIFYQNFASNTNWAQNLTVQ
jgi:hypothetical protein